MGGEKGAWEGWMGATDTLRGRKLEWLNAMGIVCRLSTARERVGCSRGWLRRTRHEARLHVDLAFWKLVLEKNNGVLSLHAKQ